ncbi:winged helix domain-containing protein [Actibacterium pelagium]|uniref:Winged helix domain-containing protein n=1 Tax=Actibacterium pelagium TaxID=2029103 RepID=A0A917EJ20_9RHOB|nr:hypothetical protein [Actibacterium pelagium]GGE41414.1 hypothetical protein GCM10011517_06280 [Actibacterium pelagium]
MQKSKINTWSKAKFSIANEGSPTFYIGVGGRQRWALECLLRAGKKGCSPIDHPGPRWSGYVFDLRELGVQIETITEAHDGPFAGTHARYVLRSQVQLVEGNAA